MAREGTRTGGEREGKAGNETWDVFPVVCDGVALPPCDFETLGTAGGQPL